MKRALLLGLAFAAGVATAAPVTTHVQARLLDAGGTPVTGNTSFEVRLFNDPVNGAERFAESFTSVLSNGYLSVQLGASTTPLEGAVFSEPLWVEVAIDNVPVGLRTPLASAPVSAVTQGVVAGTLPACAVGQEGTVRFDLSQDVLMVCAGASGWQPVHAGPRIVHDTTITVAPSGGDHASLTSAMDWLRERSIAPEAVVTVSIQPGTYVSEPVSLNHPQGNQISIVGDTTTPSNVTLSFSDDAWGMNLSNGFVLSRLEGIRLQGNSTDTLEGLRIRGVLRLLHVEASGFTTNSVFVSAGTVESGTVSALGVAGAGVGNVGIRLNQGATVYLPGSTFDGFEGNGIRVADSSTGVFSGSTVNNSGSTAVVVTEGSSLYLDDGFITNAGLDGLFVGGSASVRANRITVQNAGNNGLVSYESSSLYADDAVISNSASSGLFAAWGGFLRAEGADVDQGARALYCTTNGTVRARNLVASNSSVFGVDARTGCTAWLSGGVFVNNNVDTNVADTFSTIFF